MSIQKIIVYPDPILKLKSEPVEEQDKELDKLIKDMKDTLNSVPGLGLAAIQIGVPRRVFIYDETPGEEKGTKYFSVLINPEIVSMEGKVKEEEGCLSIPDYRDTVVRAAMVTVKGKREDGKEVEITAEGLLARVFQHEIDHLDGILFIDRLSSLKRGLFYRKMKKRQRQAKVELAEKI